jgi:hypothetical protein
MIGFGRLFDSGVGRRADRSDRDLAWDDFYFRADDQCSGELLMSMKRIELFIASHIFRYRCILISSCL